MFGIFKFIDLRRPKLTSVVDDELYEAQRARLNAMAAVDLAQQKVVEAKSRVVTAKAHLAYCNRRVEALQKEQEARALQPGTWVSTSGPQEPEMST